MSSFEPSRIPAWLAPVCEERSVSHSASRCEPSASQRAMVGALPSRIARRSTGSASPSISRKTIPGTSVLGDDRPAGARSAARSGSTYVSSRAEEAPRARRSRRRRRARRAAPSRSCRPSSTPSVRSSASRRMSASAIRTSRKPSTSVSGSRSAASRGGMTAFSAATIAATTSAPQKLFDVDAGQEPGGHHQRDRRCASQEMTSGNEPQPRSLGPPGGGLAVRLLGRARHRAPPPGRPVRHSSSSPRRRRNRL